MSDHEASAVYHRAAGGHFITPFHVAISPMERLLLLGFEKDPDQTYTGFEPQFFDDPIHGRGLIVIAYRRDSKVDVYHQPGLTLDPADYDIVVSGLNAMVERPFDGAFFHIGPQGVDLAFAFEDLEGRPIEVRLRETGHKPRTPATILAPMGSSTANPPALPLVLLYGFDFVRRSGTQLDIRIAGRAHQADRFPIPMNGRRVYFLRYASGPFIVTLNPTHDGPLPVHCPDGSRSVTDQGVTYELAENAGHFEINQMQAGDSTRTFTCAFEPAFPDLLALRDGASLHGTFTITCKPPIGRISGTYGIQRLGPKVKLTLHPGDGWQPNEENWSFRLAFLMLRVLRKWPSTYQWEAMVDLSEPETPHLVSAWRRLTTR